MKPVGKPDAGNPHVRFDERGRETGSASRPATAPFLDSTTAPAVNVAKAAELAYMVMRRHRQVYRQV